MKPPAQAVDRTHAAESVGADAASGRSPQKFCLSASAQTAESLLDCALHVLQDRFGWRAASLGLVWGLWHLPLFFIDGTAQAHIPPGLFLLSVVAMSVVFAWLVKRTAGSVVAALALHTAINFWPSFVPVLPTDASYRAYAFVVAMLVLLALWASGPTAVRRAVGSLPGFAEKKP